MTDSIEGIRVQLWQASAMLTHSSCLLKVRLSKSIPHDQQKFVKTEERISKDILHEMSFLRIFSPDILSCIIFFHTTNENQVVNMFKETGIFKLL